MKADGAALEVDLGSNFDHLSKGAALKAHQARRVGFEIDQVLAREAFGLVAVDARDHAARKHVDILMQFGRLESATEPLVRLVVDRLPALELPVLV